MDVPHLQRFYRQYLQQFSNPIVPAGSFLKDDSIQLLLAERFFNETNFHRLPFEYQRKALDRVIKAIESSITDPEEEAVSDALYEYRALLAQTPPDDLTVKKTITYFPPVGLEETSPPTIYIQEAKHIIGSGPSTGLRTWEASLRLACYLHGNQTLVRDRSVLELGAGSGLLSLFCARVLDAGHVVTTDGDAGVLTGLEANVQLNRKLLVDRIVSNGAAGTSPSPDHIKWPTARQLYFADSEALTSILATAAPDLVLGADITYHLDIIDDLVLTLLQLLEHNPSTQILISSTIRNLDSVSHFRAACEKYGLQAEALKFDVPNIHEQTGLFHAVAMEIQIFQVKMQRWVVEDDGRE